MAQVLCHWEAVMAVEVLATDGRVISKGCVVEAKRVKHPNVWCADRWTVRPLGSQWTDGERLVVGPTDIHSMSLVPTH